MWLKPVRKEICIPSAEADGNGETNSTNPGLYIMFRTSRVANLSKVGNPLQSNFHKNHETNIITPPISLNLPNDPCYKRNRFKIGEIR